MEFFILFAFAVFGIPLLFLWVDLVFLGSFLVANFLTLEKREPVNIQISISEYLNYLFDRSSFLNKLSTKWDTDFVNKHYFGGCKYVSRF
mgnify:FL=1|tara:strand:- start:561 stop:830 length:270 start_codon:yes stop_codon:yes gene_type:complete